MDLIVYEFYASLKERENRRLLSEILTHITVRGQHVLVMPHGICHFYDALFYASNFLDSIDLNFYRGTDMDAIINYLTDRQGEWAH
ncbi:hypothetical protein PVK06_043086 [Gossypium arboreum]|uniref:Uncharacterized protein n=1 Tax=Gossypium arboreum TaxID=29729 RepID=A0ABR0MMJ2_GOSAR|nr:hypothetical protein PVK06_043086 [Gossypium arboreum]